MSSPFLAEIRIFAGNFAPKGWAMCDGQILMINTNTALFSLMGTFYGGDGSSTFALPDLRGRVPIHQGQGFGLSQYVIGQQGGAETVALTVGQMPAHNHLVTADGTASDTLASNPMGHWLAPSGLNVDRYTYSRTDPLTNPVTMHPQMIGITGLGQAHNNVQPFLVLTFIIALQGIFPSQN
ncbi:MAG: phage tail protein [Candidatus Eremiobacteraeota bacterium]|nr:phage tail protein [Candidatus Eremiobacteraeota bacterium]